MQNSKIATNITEKLKKLQLLKGESISGLYKKRIDQKVQYSWNAIWNLKEWITAATTEALSKVYTEQGKYKHCWTEITIQDTKENKALYGKWLRTQM